MIVNVYSIAARSKCIKSNESSSTKFRMRFHSHHISVIVDKCAAQCPFYTKRNTTCSTVVSLFESVERKLLDTMSANDASNPSMAAVSSDYDFINCNRKNLQSGTY